MLVLYILLKIFKNTHNPLTQKKKTEGNGGGGGRGFRLQGPHFGKLFMEIVRLIQELHLQLIVVVRQ